MNKEVLVDKRKLAMTRIENALDRMKGGACSYASLARALWNMRRSRSALSGQGTTEYAILVGVFSCYSNYRHYGISSQNPRIMGRDLFGDQRALGLLDLSAGNV